MDDFKLQERDAKIIKKLWESMLLINNNFDTKDPIVMAVIDKIAYAVRILEAGGQRTYSLCFRSRSESRKGGN